MTFRRTDEKCKGQLPKYSAELLVPHCHARGCRIHYLVEIVDDRGVNEVIVYCFGGRAFCDHNTPTRLCGTEVVVERWYINFGRSV